MASQADDPDLRSAPGLTRPFEAADERPHRPDATAGWWEAWQLDVASDDGVGIAVRLALSPDLGVAWFWTHALLPDRPGPVVVRDHDVPMPRQGLEIRADGLWAELVCETPFEHWTYGLEAFGVRLDDPAESLRCEIGERMPVGFDLEWEVDPAVGEVRDRRTDVEQGYEQFGVVHGELLLGRSRVEIDAAALRSHVWGVAEPERAFASYWMRAPGIAVSEMARDVPPHETLGSFVVPPTSYAGAPVVLTRTLCRFDAPAGNGWSTRLEPE